VIPSDKKYFRNYAVSEILVETLRDMKIEMPPVSVDIGQVRREYEQAKLWEQEGRDPSGEPKKGKA